MKAAAILPNEVERLAALEETRLVFSPAEERFDRITRLAANVFDAPIALVSLVGETQQYFKSAQGMDALQSPRETSFCAHALVDGDHLFVEDAAADERFADNPLVTGEPHIRAYAGKVIRSQSGQPLGTLCVIDSAPRKFTAEQIALLGDLKNIAEMELRRSTQGVQFQLLRETVEQEREQKLDATTRCWNHDAMVELLLREAQSADAAGATFALGLIHVERLRQVSHRVGEDEKDLALREVAAAIKRVLVESDALGRFDTDSFVMLLPGMGRQAAGDAAERVRKAVTGQSFRVGALSLWLDATLAVVLRRPGTPLASLVESATQLLEKVRREGKVAVVLANA